MLTFEYQHIATGLSQQRRGYCAGRTRANDGDVNVFVLVDCLMG